MFAAPGRGEKGEAEAGVGLAEVAGELAIAARIRPTVRRLRGDIEGDEEIVEDVDEEEDEQDADLDPLVSDPNAT
jgi:hypothetical protein